MNNVIRKMCVLLLLASAAVALASGQETANLSKMREQIRVLESVLNQNLAQTFPAPFGYLDAARGVYLPGYGVVVAFEVSLSRASMGPFEAKPTAQSERARHDEEKRRREQARAMAERILADFGYTLDQIAADESLAIVIHGSAVGQQGIEKSTTVLRAQKRDIDDLRANTLDRAAFLRKLQVLEY